MIEQDSLQDSYSTRWGTSTPDEYPSRIQQYAQQLREDQAFKTQITQHIATDIHLHLTRLKPKLTNKSFNINKAVIYLEKLFKNIFQEQEFWEQKTTWILSHLDAWQLEGKQPNPSNLLIYWTGVNYSTTDDKESYIISLCASKTAGEFIHKFNLYNLPLETLQNLIGMARQKSMRVKRRKFQKSTTDTNSRKQIPGWVLAKALELKSWSYAHLAKQLGVHKSLPGKWIQGDLLCSSASLSQNSANASTVDLAMVRFRTTPSTG